MGDGEKASLRLQFNPKVRLAFHGATITTDAGLLVFREFDDALGLTEIAEDYLQESRTGRNILHHLVPLLRQSIYSRLAGYNDTNDAVRLSQDPAMRVIVGWQGSERKGASTSEMGRFETEFLTQEDNRQALPRMNTRWVERAMALDNAPMESFWGTLKQELVHHRHYRSRQEAIRDITEYIEIFYPGFPRSNQLS